MTVTELTLHDPDRTQGASRDYLTFAELCAMLRISKPVGERLKAAGKLPPHIALSQRTHRWRRQVVLDHLRRLEEETARRQARAR